MLLLCLTTRKYEKCHPPHEYANFFIFSKEKNLNSSFLYKNK